MSRPAVRMLALLALLAVPLVASGHHHGVSGQPSDCSLCVVAHRLPAEAVAKVALAVAVTSRPAPATPEPSSGLSVDPSVHPGRAPPRLSGGSTT